MFLHPLVVVVCFLLEFSFGVSDMEDYDAPKASCSADSKEVAACVHRYIEKDFFSISPYIYGKRESVENSVCPKRNEAEKQASSGGQEFEQNCKHLYDVLLCLQKELGECDRISSYFLLRNLIHSLQKIIFWLCGSQRDDDVHVSWADANATQEARGRFLDLLSSLECLECIRTKLSKRECSSSELVIDSHLWTKILRLELGPIEVCPQLKKQTNCIQSRQLAIRYCNSKANDLHLNLTNLLISTWCNSNPLFSSGGISINRQKMSQNRIIYFPLYIIINIHFNYLL